MIERPAVRPAFLGDPAADPALELRRDADAFDDAPTEDRTVARRSRVERELDARRAGVHHQDGIGFRHRLLSSPRRFGLQRGLAGRPYHIPWLVRLSNDGARLRFPGWSFGRPDPRMRP